MIQLSRYVGEWLDKNKEDTVDKTLNKALDVIHSDISKAMTRQEVFELVKIALEKDAYFYVVPIEKSVSEMKVDKYYRYEVTKKITDNGNKTFTEVIYGKGDKLIQRFIDERDNIFSNTILNVTIFEYDTFEGMVYDMSEECYLMDNMVYIVTSQQLYKPVQWLDNKRDVFFEERNNFTMETTFYPIVEGLC
ncbi:hypothetical protein ACVRZC_10040 [Streptococcus hyointestinalis]|uniref:Uncharacterized protein n=1 Tax=Streptococcus hyointestinalis TaxID=1337 RepID=A0A380K041_9STRE|nr:hypothetical protein [Streptococcus hyointestinalis]SUN58105.1 Uncharacterised protein [Streptococcus hyointestinalis]